jgi:regulation of enolase protein 1 (concanavalin A-like superfamily)
MPYMRPRPSAVAAAVATLLLTLQLPVNAQPELDRLYGRITTLPTLVFELWPGDFNGDGITDLVAGTASDTIVVTLGRGDGTFGPEVIVATGLRQPVGVGDLNSDGHLDVLAITPAVSGSTATYIVAGRGDGTFDPPVVTGLSLGAPTYIADMNGDAIPDVVGLGIDAVHVYPGAGDFTFGTPTVLRTGIMARNMVVADLNGDTLPDLAVATFGIPSIDLFYNLGQFAFSMANIPLDLPAVGITAWDLNRDGATDLVASAGRYVLSVAPHWTSGVIYVLLGRGDGTFAEPVSYQTNNGPQTAVVGDFNGDGLADLATGNQSYGFACESFSHLWDSISLLPGRGDGTFGPADSYALGHTDEPPETILYRRAHHRLNTSDLNGDGRTDLIASPGAILLATPPVENRPPVADAGSPRLLPPAEQETLRGSATDPDNDWLTFRWTDETGRVVGTVPHPCVRGYTGAPTFTLTVTDGHGGVSVDSVTHFSLPPTDLPSGWSQGDIGAVGQPGRVLFSGSSYLVSGSGADIWGTEDAFQFVQTAITGDFEATVRVASLEHVDDWTKAGLMIRDGLSPGARHVSVLATPSSLNGVAFQRRTSPGDLSVHTAGPSVGPPVWLRLRREGDLVSAFARVSVDDEWTVIGAQTLAGLPSTVSTGLAVTSHLDGALATAVFDGLTIVPLTTMLPDGWTSADVGPVGAPGSATFAGGTFTLTNAGTDIWDTEDAFHFAHTTVSGSFEATVRVASLEHVHDWTKAGLMIRDGLSPDARHAFVLTTPSSLNGVAFQGRTVAGGSSVHTAGPAVGPPVWLRLRREGDHISAFVRVSDADPWTALGAQTLAGLPAAVSFGLAVTSHSEDVSATAVFDSLSISPLGAALPDGWTSADIGSVGALGGAAFAAGVFAVQNAGTDIWGTEDAFHYVYREAMGDFDVRARVLGLDAPHEWAKAGLMVRESLEPNARHHTLLASRDHGLAHQWRPEAGGLSLHAPLGTDVLPAWFRITRTGATVHLSWSADGSSWTPVTSTEFGAGAAFIGLAVTSHDVTNAAIGTFDNVVATAVPATAWSNGDVGAVQHAGSSVFDGQTYAVTASGDDIWHGSDGFHFVHRPLTGAGRITARVSVFDAPHSWAMGGVLFRASTDPSSVHASLLVSFSVGLAFLGRVEHGALSIHPGAGSAGAPHWVRLTRVDTPAGAIITASVSPDGVQWTDVGSESLPSLPATALVGLAVTSHDNTAVATAIFDHVMMEAVAPPASLTITGPATGRVLPALATFTWDGGGDEFWLEIGSAPGRSDYYASGSLGVATEHAVSSLPLNGEPMYVQVRRRVGSAVDVVSAQYMASIRRGLAVITDFADRRLEDWPGQGIRTEDEVLPHLRNMEAHWEWLSRGRERMQWDVIRIQLPATATPDAFPGGWSAFRLAAASLIRSQVPTADYDVDHDGEIDAAWLVVSSGELEFDYAIGGASRNGLVNMFVDGQASASVTSGAYGNFNHELGHLLGLPDMYGPFDTLDGLTLMAFSWPVPARDFAAYERVHLGWVQPRVVTGTTRDIWLPSEHERLAAVKVPTADVREYFLIEYRRRPDEGFGSTNPPFNGLAVYHVLEGSSNFQEPSLVKLEPADGSIAASAPNVDPLDFVYPENPVLLRPMVVRSYFGGQPEVFRIENVAWRDGGIAFDVVMPP